MEENICKDCEKNPVAVEGNGWGGEYSLEVCSPCKQREAGKRATDAFKFNEFGEAT